MENDKEIKPPAAGIVYGTVARCVIIIGVIIAITGSIMYFASNGYLDRETLITDLWQGIDCGTIWQTCASNNAGFQDHWYLSWLSCGDAIAMLGIAVTCLAGVIGMWGALLGTIRSKTKMYVIFTFITAVVLTLSAIGVVKMV